MATMNIRIDDGLKSDVEKVLSSLGLNISDAVRIYFSKIRDNRGIPFDLKLSDDYNYNIYESVKESLEDVKAGRVSKPYSDTWELIQDCLKD